MKTIRHSRVVAFVSATVLLFQISTAFADGSQATTKEHRRRVEMTLTKWITAYPLMAGLVEGDLNGEFVGEIFTYQTSANGRITRLEALYEVEAGDHSFKAFMQGGKSNATGKGLLDGVILDGWRRGAPVHYEFDTKTDCVGAPAGVCFQGTLEVGRAPQD